MRFFFLILISLPCFAAFGVKPAAVACVPSLELLAASTSPVVGFIREFGIAKEKKLVRGKDIVIEAPPKDVAMKPYGSAMDELGRAVKKTLPYTPNCVVYLFAGTDSGVFRVFPEAAVIIMQGQAPFAGSLDPSEVDRLKHVVPGSGISRGFEGGINGWLPTGRFNSSEGVGHEILGAMAGNIPKIRFRSIRLFTKESVVKNLNDADKRVNAVVSFDEGAGTQLRHLVYFSEFNLQQSYKNAWWLSAIAASKPDTLYEKASDSAWGSYGRETLRTTVTNLLLANQEVPFAIESRNGNWGEFSGRSSPKNNRVDLFRYRKSHGLDIGYSGEFQIQPLK